MSILRSAKIIAANDAALTRKQSATPTVAIVRPASAGPATRATCTSALLSPTAFTRRAELTSSTRNACRAGLSTTFTAPRANTSTKIIHGCTTPDPASSQSVSAGSAIAACVNMRRRRLSGRSAITPPQAPKSSIGVNCSAVVTPTASGLPVSERTSHSSPTVCIQVPLSETIWPTK